jgi:hypothetical protein
MLPIGLRLDMHQLITDTVRRALADWRRRESRDDSDEVLATIIAEQLNRYLKWDQEEP